MGGTNDFEHFLLNKEGQGFKVPNGNFSKMSIKLKKIRPLFFAAKLKQLFHQLLPFKFVQNKIAIVEKENETDYIAMQYLIENDWNLVLTKCMDQEAEKKWILKRKIAGGQLCELVGIRKVYYDQRAKFPKSPMIVD